MDRCFEEYHDYLHTFVWEGERLLVAEDGSTGTTDGFHLPGAGYMIYYVPAMEGETTDIPVPPDCEYEISGDNANGFIVTVKLGA
jgi:D-alanyl-D-alanine carboxypeptidase